MQGNIWCAKKRGNIPIMANEITPAGAPSGTTFTNKQAHPATIIYAIKLFLIPIFSTTKMHIATDIVSTEPAITCVRKMFIISICVGLLAEFIK